MKIAISAARLEHLPRGVETWAMDTFEALLERGVDVTLYKGSGPCRSSRERVLPSIKKNSRLSRLILSLRPGFCWRLCLGSGDTIEELTFAFGLIREARRHQYDIIHMQDPNVANILRSAARRGWIRSKVILGNGTEESPEFLAQFDYVQHLAPWHKAQAERALCDQETALRGTLLPLLPSVQNSGGREHKATKETASVRVTIPNFVDTEVFRPPASREEKVRCRAQFGIPADAFVVIAVGALKRGHKRVDWIIGEFARFAAKTADVRLLLVGASTPDTPAILAEVAEKAGDRIVIMANQSREDMPRLLAASDIFVHGALFEMMPIAFLEAMASGLPIVSHGHPVMQWMAGEGRADVDMTKEGSLAEQLHQLHASPQVRTDLGRKARARALQMFAKEVVVDQMLAMYRAVTQRAD